MASSQPSDEHRRASMEDKLYLWIDDEEKSTENDDTSGNGEKENGMTGSVSFFSSSSNVTKSREKTTFHDCGAAYVSLGRKDASTDDISVDDSNATINTGSSCNDNGAGTCFIEENLPPQLHPAVSLGMHRATSFYFSVTDDFDTSNSMADLLTLLTTNDDESVNNSTSTKHVVNATTANSTTPAATNVPLSIFGSNHGDNNKVNDELAASVSEFENSSKTANSLKHARRRM